MFAENSFQFFKFQISKIRVNFQKKKKKKKKKNSWFSF